MKRVSTWLVVGVLALGGVAAAARGTRRLVIEALCNLAINAAERIWQTYAIRSHSLSD